MEIFTNLLLQMESIALILVTGGLAVVWISYQKQLKYQQEQDKENLKVLMNINNVLDKVQDSTKEQTSKLSMEIQQQSELTREHINTVIGKILSNEPSKR